MMPPRKRKAPPTEPQLRDSFGGGVSFEEEKVPADVSEEAHEAKQRLRIMF